MAPGAGRSYLQENIAGVTFCNLDREVCDAVGSPWTQCCSRCGWRNSASCLAALPGLPEHQRGPAGARLQASLGQQGGQQELGRQAGRLEACGRERRRRKMISALQQLLLQTGAHSYHRGHCCGEARGPWGCAPSRSPLWHCLGPGICGHSHWGWDQVF